MTTIKRGPDQPLMRADGTWDWEQDTIVDLHNRIDFRLRRYVRQLWLWALIIGILVVALFNPAVMRVLIALAGLGLQLLFLASFMIFQFVVFFWFGSRTRMYEVMPGAEGIGFEDYRGQPELLEQARQIVTLLRGVRAFEGSGGEPMNGLLLEGPPGTGKTWLAQAISTEAGVPFYYVDTSMPCSQAAAT